MDAANLQKNDEQNPAARAGVLVLQNSRQAGTRRPLGLVTTFVGQGPNCDIRLNVDGIDALHCLLVDTPHGLQLRDLNSVHGTFVNGVRVDTATLHDGDLVKIGPFQFRLDRPASSAPRETDSEPITDERLREAMRVQTAAVAAQQIALEEEEARLDQRRQDLQRQEEQLAAHLEEKQHQIQLWSDHTRSEKEALRQERIAYEKLQTRQDEELAHAQNKLVNDQRQVNQERQRIDKIYQRLKQRWKLQWAAEKEKHQKQARQLREETLRFEEQVTAFEAQRTDFGQQIIQFNTERELSLRTLHDLREGLAKDQKRWRQRCALERRGLRLKQREIDDAHNKLQQVRQMIHADKDAWAIQQAILQRELVGVNNRVINHRMQLQEFEVAVQARSHGIPNDEPIECEVEVIADSSESAPPLAIPADHDWQRREAVLGLLLSELGDQRLHLLEQFQRLVTIQESWRTQRDRASDELEAFAHRLVEREQSLAVRDHHTAVEEHRLRQRQEELEGLRQEIHVWRAQLGARERTLNDEYARHLCDMQERESSLEAQLASLTNLRQRWNQRRREELERQHANRASLGAQQKEVHELRDALFANSQQIEQEKRLVTEKALALEQYRQDLFTRANDPNAQNRVERLRRRWLSINAGLIRSSRAEHESVRKELERLSEFQAQLETETSRLELMEKDLAEKQSLLDERDAAMLAMQAKLKQENQRLENLERQAATNILLLQEEVDTLAKTIYDSPDPDATAKAA